VKRRVHPFTYFVARRDNQRRLRIHQRRDLGATCELQAALLRMGFDYGEPILNAPPERPRRDPPSGDDLYPVDISFVRPGDLLLQTTRPPLDDLDQGDRKWVESGCTDVENRLFRVWRRYFEVCSRSHVKLSRRVRRAIGSNAAHCKEMKFREANGAPYKQLNFHNGRGWQKPLKRTATAVFLLRVEEAWKGGPGLLAAFGMDGTSTMLWAYRLRTDLAHLLAKPGFVVAEMCIGEPPVRPTNLRWAKDIEVEVLVHYSEEEAASSSTSVQAS
jgi:hypothetical protein